jgi:hypothetical protein
MRVVSIVRYYLDSEFENVCDIYSDSS